jgi:hypothetical protein
MHSIALFVGNRQVCERLKSSIDRGEIVPLPQGFCALILFAENGGSIWAEDIPDPVPGFQCLRRSWADLAGKASVGAMIAYVETEYFGGAGNQAAVVYQNGQIVTGPTTGDSGSRSEWPINAAMRSLGVKRGDYVDEFAAIGFGLVRKNEDFKETDFS